MHIFVYYYFISLLVVTIYRCNRSQVIGVTLANYEADMGDRRAFLTTTISSKNS